MGLPLWSRSRGVSRARVGPAILTIDRALEWWSTQAPKKFPCPFRDSLSLSVADGGALPPLLPGSGLFRRARWNYVRKAFFSPSPPSPSALYTRPSRPTSHFPLFTPFLEPSYQRRLRRTTLRRSFPLVSLYKTSLRPVNFQFFGDFPCDLYVGLCDLGSYYIKEICVRYASPT